MKKLYLSILGALLAFSAGARELTFYMGETPVANGSSITSEAIEIEDFGDYKEVKMDPELYLMSDIFTADVEIKASCLSGQSIQLCAGGNCMKGTTVTKSGVKINANQRLPLQFDYVGEVDADEPVPTVVTLIEAVDTKHTETAKSFTITMGENASVNAVENKAGGLTVTPAGIVYLLDAPIDFALFNITGQRVCSARLSGNGIFSTTSLPKGLYVYRAGKHSGKIIVK